MAQRFNILHLSGARSWRGGEQQLVYLRDELTAMGHHNVLMMPRGSALEAKAQAADWPHLSYAKWTAYNPMAAWQLRRYVKQHNIHIVHAHDPHAHSLAVIAASLGMKTAPIVLSRRVDFRIKSKAFTQWKYNHPAIAKVLCVSKAIESIVKADTQLGQRTSCVYSGVDLHKADRAEAIDLKELLQLPSTVFVVGNISALADHKDYPTFLRVARRLKSHEDIHFVVVGEGAMRKEMEAYIAKHQLENVHLLGFRSDPMACMKALDVLLFTSKTEGLGTTLLDAMLAKVPIVGTPAGGAAELLQHEHNALVAEIGDDEHLAEHVLRIQNDAALRQSLCSAANTFVQQFSTKHMAEATLVEYKKLLS